MVSMSSMLSIEHLAGKFKPSALRFPPAGRKADAEKRLRAHWRLIQPARAIQVEGKRKDLWLWIQTIEGTTF